jgi:hypothetical protein
MKMKVRFDLSKNKVYYMLSWSYAYKQSRKGQWECAARDRNRFQRRIDNIGEVLVKVLGSDHRLHIYQERFQDFKHISL